VHQPAFVNLSLLRHFSFNTSWALEIVRTKTAEKVTVVTHNETHQQSILLLLKTISFHLCFNEKLLVINSTTAFAQSSVAIPKEKIANKKLGRVGTS